MLPVSPRTKVQSDRPIQGNAAQCAATVGECLVHACMASTLLTSFSHSKICSAKSANGVPSGGPGQERRIE
jgi:hypothetical protein